MFPFVYKVNLYKSYMEEDEVMVDEVEDDSGFDTAEDFADYSQKTDFSKAILTFEAFKKCIEARGKEMKKGFFNTILSKDGSPVRTWVEDTRKIYCSCVMALWATLEPEIINDKGFDESKFKFDEIKKKYFYYPYVKKKVEGQLELVQTSEGYLPEEDEVVEVVKSFPDGTRVLDKVPGGWNQKVNRYWNEMVDEYDKLYRELMRVVHRANYFRQKMTFG